MLKSNLYNYNLPKELIPSSPADPRDSSKLFIYHTRTDIIEFGEFYDLDKFLPKNSFLVLNNTKVLPARIEMKKQNGAKVTCLLLMNEIIKKDIGIVVKALPDRKINVGEKLYIDPEHEFEIIYQNKNIFYLKLKFEIKELYKILLKAGKTPIPLYLRKSSLSETDLRKKYQTVFAEKIGSVAAPTASLHFTANVFTKLENKGIKKFYITLHVGMGTFAPVNEENIRQNKLHEEFYDISLNDIREMKKLKSRGYKLIAAGTTTVRTLESAIRSPDRYDHISDPAKTDLFIIPPYKFEMVDILLTNFHLPGSSLMMLVEAFLQYKGSKRHLVDLYNIAIKEKFRFFSFGDAMLIL